jgi:hypothetical protein
MTKRWNVKSCGPDALCRLIFCAELKRGFNKINGMTVEALLRNLGVPDGVDQLLADKVASFC